MPFSHTFWPSEKCDGSDADVTRRAAYRDDVESHSMPPRASKKALASEDGDAVDQPQSQPRPRKASKSSKDKDAYGFRLQLKGHQRQERAECSTSAQAQLPDWSFVPQGRGFPSARRVKKMMRMGVPPEYRGSVWMEVSGAAGEADAWGLQGDFPPIITAMHGSLRAPFTPHEHSHAGLPARHLPPARPQLAIFLISPSSCRYRSPPMHVTVPSTPMQPCRPPSPPPITATSPTLNKIPKHCTRLSW